MKLLTRLFKSAQRRYLRARIVYERPDLKGEPFIKQLRTYISDEMDEHLKTKTAYDPLPDFVVYASNYEAIESIGFYKARFELFRKQCGRLSDENTDLVSELYDVRKENIELHELAKLATDMVANSRGNN